MNDPLLLCRFDGVGDLFRNSQRFVERDCATGKCAATSPGPRQFMTSAKADWWLWAWLSHAWSGWRTSLVIVKPETSSPGIDKNFGCSGHGSRRRL